MDMRCPISCPKQLGVAWLLLPWGLLLEPIQTERVLETRDGSDDFSFPGNDAELADWVPKTRRNAEKIPTSHRPKQSTIFKPTVPRTEDDVLAKVPGDADELHNYGQASVNDFEDQHGGSDKEDQCWKTMQEAGWSNTDIERQIAATKGEAKDSEFQRKLLNIIVKKSIRLEQGRLPTFAEVGDGAEFYLEQEKTKQGEKKAVFVLGPSCSGKTAVAASLPLFHAQDRFPLMTVDGADWRSVSSVWQTNAKAGFKTIEGKQCFYKDYFTKVFQTVKKDMHIWMMEQIRIHQPKTVVIPSTAVPCIFPRFTSSCKIRSLIDQMESYGYTVSFVVIHADKSRVVARGRKRQKDEGKAYSSAGYELAYLSPLTLMSRYTDESKWSFYYNRFAGPPIEMGSVDYRAAALHLLPPSLRALYSGFFDW